MKSASGVPAVELVNLMASKSERRSSQLKQSILDAKIDATLWDYGTEQISQVARASLAIHLDVKKYGRISEYLFTFLQDRAVPMTLINAGRYVLLVPKNQRHCSASPAYSMPIQVSFKVFLFLHSLSVVNQASSTCR